MLLKFIIIDKGQVKTRIAPTLSTMDESGLSKNYIIYASININESGKIESEINSAKKYAEKACNSQTFHQ